MNTQHALANHSRSRTFPTEAKSHSVSTIGVIDTDTVHVVRAGDSMHLHRLYASKALVEDARERDDLRVIEEPSPIEFADGQFASPSLRE